MKNIARLFREARSARGWSEVELVKAAGIKRIEKGLRRLRAIESGEDALPQGEVINKFAGPLCLTNEQIILALCEDFAALDQPIPSQVVIRWIPAVYGTMRLPENCTPEEAIKMATKFSREKGFRTCVRLSNIRTVYVEPDGSRMLSFAPPSGGFRFSAALPESIQIEQAPGENSNRK
jgi:transcriptional regulator with XRE-family HTH domain